MSWIIVPTIGRPDLKIVWDNVLYRTYLKIGGKEYPPNETIEVNILTEPDIKLVVVGENRGSDGYGWVALTARSEKGKEALLFIKQNVLGTGDIIVGSLEAKIDREFYNFMSYFTEFKENIQLIGYVGIGNFVDMYRGIVPYAYVVDWRSNRVEVAWTPEELGKVILDMYRKVPLERYGEELVQLQPLIEVFCIEPVDIPELGIRITTADAGFDLYNMYVQHKDLFEKVGISGLIGWNWSVLNNIATDSTLNYRRR